MIANKRVKQGMITTHTKIDSKYVSIITDELSSMGWVSKTDYKTHKEIVINPHRVKEMKEFIRYWKFRQKAFTIRPHHIIVYGSFSHKPNFDLIPFKFVSMHKKNKGTEIMLDTDYGHITIYRNKPTIKFTILDLHIITDEKGLEDFADYLEVMLIERINHMVNFLSNYETFGKVKIDNLKLLDNSHLGIVTKKDLAKHLRIDKDLEETGLFVDESITDFDEWEKKGNLNNVIEKIGGGLKIFFEAQNKEE